MSLEHLNCPPCIMYGGKTLHDIFLSNNATKTNTVYKGDSHVKLAFNITRGFNVVQNKEEFEKLYAEWTMNTSGQFSKYFCGNSDYSYLERKVETLYKEQEKKKTITVLPCRRYCASLRYEHRLCTLCPYSPEYLNGRIDVENEMLGYALANLDTRFSSIAFSFLALSAESVVYEDLAVKITGSYPVVCDGSCTDFVNLNSLIAYFLLYHHEDIKDTNSQFMIGYNSVSGEDLSLFYIRGIYDAAETLNIGGAGKKSNAVRDYSFSGLGLSCDDVIEQFRPVIDKLLEIGKSVTDSEYTESIDYLSSTYSFNDYHEYPSKGKYELYVDSMENPTSRAARVNPTASVVEMSPLAKGLIENSSLMQVDSYRQEIERQCVYVDAGTVEAISDISDFSFPVIDEEPTKEEIAPAQNNVSNGATEQHNVEQESVASTNEKVDQEVENVVSNAAEEQSVDEVEMSVDVTSDISNSPIESESEVELSSTEANDLVSDEEDANVSGFDNSVIEQSSVEVTNAIISESDHSVEVEPPVIVDHSMDGIPMSTVATVTNEVAQQLSEESSNLEEPKVDIHSDDLATTTDVQEDVCVNPVEPFEEQKEIKEEVQVEIHTEEPEIVSEETDTVSIEEEMTDGVSVASDDTNEIVLSAAANEDAEYNDSEIVLSASSDTVDIDSNLTLDGLILSASASEDEDGNTDDTVVVLNAGGSEDTDIDSTVTLSDLLGGGTSDAAPDIEVNNSNNEPDSLEDNSGTIVIDTENEVVSGVIEAEPIDDVVVEVENDDIVMEVESDDIVNVEMEQPNIVFDSSIVTDVPVVETEVLNEQPKEKEDVFEKKVSVLELRNKTIDTDPNFFNSVETFFGLNDYQAKKKVDELIGLLGDKEPVAVECCKHDEMELYGMLIYISYKHQFWYLAEGCLGFTDVLWHLFITERVKLCLNYPFVASMLSKYNFNFKGLFSLSTLYEASQDEPVRLMVGDVMGKPVMSDSNIYSQIMPLYCERYNKLRELALNEIAETRFDEYCDYDDVLAYSVDVSHVLNYDSPIAQTENYKDFIFHYSEDIPIVDGTDYSIIKLSLDKKYYVDFNSNEMYKHFLRRLMLDNCFVRYGLSLLSFEEGCIIFACQTRSLFTIIDVLVEKAKNSYKYFNEQLIPVFEVSKITN